MNLPSCSASFRSSVQGPRHQYGPKKIAYLDLPKPPHQNHDRDAEPQEHVRGSILLRGMTSAAAGLVGLGVAVPVGAGIGARIHATLVGTSVGARIHAASVFTAIGARIHATIIIAARVEELRA